MAQSAEEMHVGLRIFVGGLALGAGLWIVAIGFGWAPSEPGSVHAPFWVIAVAGGMFALVGAWLMTVGSLVGAVLARVVGPAVLVGLLIILHWIAFGPGVRTCTASLSIPFLSSGGPASDVQCRLGFGYAAVLFDGLLGGAILGQWAESRLQGAVQTVVKRVSDVMIVVPLLPVIVPLALAGGLQALREKLGKGGGKG